jgi:hypothetical protein
MANETYVSRTYRDYLQTALAGRGGLTSRQVNSIVSQYDTAVAWGQSVQQTFARLLESYGSEDTQAACASIQSELEKMNTEHQGVDVNSVTRLRAYLDKHRANLSRCSVEITDDRGNTKTIGGKTVADTVKDPSFLPARSQTYTHTATARYGNKNVKLALDITI